MFTYLLYIIDRIRPDPVELLRDQNQRHLLARVDEFGYGMYPPEMLLTLFPSYPGHGVVRGTEAISLR